MPAASRVRLVPPDAWDEPRLLEATRDLGVATPRALMPGDEMQGLVVVGVEPQPGAASSPETTYEVLARPRAAHATSVDIALLLDVSESMELPWSGDHTRVEATREAVAAFLRKPGASVAHVALLEYAKEARVLAGPSPPERLTLPVAPKPKGRSHPGTALDAALATLTALGGERAQAVILLTDGLAEVERFREAARRAARLAIPVHVLVFAPLVDPELEEIVRTTGGSAQKATLPLTIEFEHGPGGG